jgi:hypothetical protein
MISSETHRRPRSPYLTVVGVALMAVLFAAFASAPATAAIAHATTTEYCTVVVKRIHPQRPETTVVHRACASTPTASSLAVPSSQVPILQVFEDADWGGRYVTIDGYDPCDRYGYTINDLSWANGQVNGISSFAVLNNCTFSSTYHDTNRTNFCADADGNVNYVGNYCNDHLYSMRLWSS